MRGPREAAGLRRRDELLHSLQTPHPESRRMDDAGLSDGDAQLPDTGEGLLDQAAGKAVRRARGRGLDRGRRLPNPTRVFMTTPTLTDKVREALQSLNLEDATIDVQGAAASIFATVTSRAFNGVEEAERQRRVWQVLREYLDESERQAVEFVFTESPDDPIEAGAEDGHP